LNSAVILSMTTRRMTTVRRIEHGASCGMASQAQGRVFYKLRLRTESLSRKITHVDCNRQVFTNCYQEISHEPYFRTTIDWRQHALAQ
jgi:hypothetical protein